MHSRPNVLLILTDQHNASIAGFSGNRSVNTRHLDALAERSVVCTNATCTSPVCTPSRMSLLTGKDIHHCGAWNNHWPIGPEHVTWPQHFANNGYSTCLVGKMHFGGKDQFHGFQYRPYGDLKHGLGHQPDPLKYFPGYAGPESAGETEIPESLISDNVITRESLAFVAEHQDREPEKPWMLCASYTRPHSPFTAPGRYIRRYRGKVSYPDVPAAYRDSLETYARNIFDICHNENLSEEQTVRAVEAYYACVDFVDDCIGELLDGLERLEGLDNTIILYTSDHGEMLGEHGLWGKAVYYDPAVMIPVLIAARGLSGGSRLETPMSIMDLYPTCARLAGLEVPEGLDGRDYAEHLHKPSEGNAPRTYTRAAYYKYAVRVKHLLEKTDEAKPYEAMRLIRTNRHKLVSIEGGGDLLFDLQNDPGEEHCVADKAAYAETVKELKEQLFSDYDWGQLREKLAADRARMAELLSGVKPSMPNQYMLADGRMLDAEKELYDARWCYIPAEATGGIIPQMFG